ncbi:MAG: LysR family transcriptional regulator [Algicola sp.]|nr:LysR family transcriptional regulator [Algicola sp.]
MNWDDLRYFLALSRARTVSGAGRDLGVKHTTVARRIQAFEQGLGTRLFDRLADGYAMTQAGENLYEHALVMEEQAQAVDRRVFGLDTQLKGKLKLTAAHDILSRMVIPHLRLFHRAYPCIELQLSSSSGLADLGARQADIALRLTPKPPDYLIGKKVLPLCQGIYGSVKYLNKNPKPNDVILWTDITEKPPWVQDHFPNAKITMYTNDITTLLACVQNHMGLARLPCYIGDDNEDLRRLDLSLAPPTWAIWVLSHVDLRSTARVRACREFLVDILEQQRDLVEGNNSVYFEV